MRILSGGIAALLVVAACGSTPTYGPLEGMPGAPTIVSVDSAHPPKALTLRLDQPAYVAVLLVAPGHSATLLYPADSTATNRLDAGTASVAFEVPGLLVRSDSAQLVRRRAQRARQDSAMQARARSRTARRQPVLGPLPPETPTLLLLVSSPQPLVYAKILEKTAGVSIPLTNTEALNAVAKAIRSTLPEEPRTLSAWYQEIDLTTGR